MQYQLNINKREIGGKNYCKKLRQRGFIPAIIYGHKIDSIPIYVNQKEFISILKKAGESSLIELNMDGEKINVLIKDYQLHPINNNILHIDFYAIKADEAVSLKIPIYIIGEPKGVKEKSGILEIILRELEIECLPADIPEKIEIDISNLDIGDEILVSDLKLSEKIKILTKADSVIALVSAPAVEEEAVAAEVPETLPEPEVIKKGKEEKESEEEK